MHTFHTSPPTLERPPQRVVSLVPSLTESLFDLGAGAAVVGVTDYCVHPAESLARLPRLGGTKNPDVDKIIALAPDLVLANWEENTRPTVEALEAAGIPVWVTCPRSVRAALADLWTLAGLFETPAAALRLKSLENAVDWATAAAQNLKQVRYFCPIWYNPPDDGPVDAGGAEDSGDWWMTFNADTYAHSILSLCGGENVFAHRARRYPLAADLGRGAEQAPDGRDTRYPRLGIEELRAAQPELILLPDEPYAFTAREKLRLTELLAGVPAADLGRIFLVGGDLITWHGTRLGRALAELPHYFE